MATDMSSLKFEIGSFFFKKGHPQIADHKCPNAYHSCFMYLILQTTTDTSVASPHCKTTLLINLLSYWQTFLKQIKDSTVSNSSWTVLFQCLEVCTVHLWNKNKNDSLQSQNRSFPFIMPYWCERSVFSVVWKNSGIFSISAQKDADVCIWIRWEAG